ncbi:MULTISPECIES: FAD:protein FMN transferase [unclassified Paenibacillus]|uniref:FAD:protein FMN transferase n=1 Tax=unclassified Paenibacillus TaxID=185978 RepID=UPI0009564455|nr:MULTISPECIES: FAD:protein FMN transferase [unclassified Paenibacillus]ASS67125.2 FAD:protein FMN transferase [Paenibacillus sp. RUD330]SIQ89134.1 thiamine biosynthesis lipoprotein [Paenibacillus sp. RU4X]SIR10010.1 thiamine biosynthesis lipoprotein [Paenibacillus sp. RU4T]
MPAESRITLRAMNTDITAILRWPDDRTPDTPAYHSLVSRWFRDVEARFSRFLPGSELCALNRTAGSWQFVSPMMEEVLSLALECSRQTGGAFHPGLLRQLQREGYRRSFEHAYTFRPAEASGQAGIKPDMGSHAAAVAQAVPFELDGRMGAVRLAPSSELDLGGIVKGWAADRLAGWLRRRHGFPSGIVNAGGDLSVWQEDKDAPSSTIAIEDPWDTVRDAARLSLKHGAAATSSTLKRRWGEDGSGLHHLIDPLTGRSAASGVVQATVAGAEAAECEAWSKTFCICGLEEGASRMKLGAPGCEAAVITDKRRLILIPSRNPGRFVWEPGTLTIQEATI